MKTFERTMLIGGHPDDIETMLGYAALGSANAYAVVACDGTESSVNYTCDPYFCQSWK